MNVCLVRDRRNGDIMTVYECRQDAQDEVRKLNDAAREPRYEIKWWKVTPEVKGYFHPEFGKCPYCRRATAPGDN